MTPLVFLLLALGADRPDVVVADFESPSYGAWTVIGTAFGPGPARGQLPGQMAVGDYRGDRLVNSFFGGDDAEGTLTSPEFVIDRRYLNFLIGGGRHPGETCINLLVDGKVARTSEGHESEFLRPESWPVGEFAGKAARVEIVDRRKGRWGHVCVDQIVLADSPPRLPDERADLLARAEAADLASAGRAASDPARPSFHVLPPGNWLNDPNGPIFHKGYYHLFFQHNPYGDDWGNIHWGHVRSKDLAHWERMPIALWPSRRAGEDHVYSGCAAVNPLGELMLFYTSIGRRDPEQWAAVPDSADLALWKKHPANPVLTGAIHGKVKVSEWRDPFVFQLRGKSYMALGGNLNENKGGQGVVNVYRAENPELTKWAYLGVLFTHPDPEVKNVECPLVFPLGEKWVVITSQGRPVHWFVGSLDPRTLRFKAERRGVVDAGNFYAPRAAPAADGRMLLWGWVPDFPKGRGWNGCLTLPRVLSLSKEGDLVSAPAPETEKLRGPAAGPIAELSLSDESRPIPVPKDDSLELRLALDPGTAKSCGLRLGRSTTISYDGLTLDVAGARVPISPSSGTKALPLRIFLDRSVLEVYPPSGPPITRVVPYAPGIEVFSVGGRATIRGLEAWPMGTIWKAE